MVQDSWRRLGKLAVRAGAASMLLAGAACTAVPDEVKPNAAAIASVAQQAAGQIRRCYRSPRVASVGRQISTRLRVRFQPDGTLAGVPTVVGQTGITPDNQAYAARMAEAASLAVLRCTPVSLPAELHAKGWSELDFTFSPGARA